MFGASKFAIDPGRRHPGFNDVGTIIGGSAGFMLGGPAGAAAGASIGGSLSASEAQTSATTQAAQISAASATDATALQREMWNQQQQNQQPWLAAGKNALSSLVSNTPALTKSFSMADYQADPGYAFRQTQGMNALQNSAAARGGLLSGNTLKGIQDYSQGVASQEYQNAYNRYQTDQGNTFNRLASVAGLGQTANSALGQAGQQYATAAGNIGMTNGMNQGNAALMAGQSRASSMQGIGQALGGVNWGGSNSPINSMLNPYGGIQM